MEIQQQLDASIQDLLNRGIIESARMATGDVDGMAGNRCIGSWITVTTVFPQFVDQNSAFPNQLQDYNCGERTYDLASGYNHQGVDIFTWPFGWHGMDHDEIIMLRRHPARLFLKLPAITIAVVDLTGQIGTPFMCSTATAP
ncbi:MAG: hypothetical protein R3C26_09695 [Calditrichia bacterium]